MFNFNTYINELFNTKNFRWIKNDDIQKIATFKIIEVYYVKFDSIGSNAFNVYFYYVDLEGREIYNLVNRINNSAYKVLSNVKKCIEDFFSKNEVDFLGFSSNEVERESLYMLLIQNLVTEDYIYSSKKVRKKRYYFMYKKEKEIESHLYITRFMENDDKIKK